MIKTKGEETLLLVVFLPRYITELAPHSSLAPTDEGLPAPALCASLALCSAFKVKVPAVPVAPGKVPKRERPHRFSWRRLSTQESC